MSQRLRALPYAGYARLRPGRIHLFCPSCHRKVSNSPRNDDPKIGPPDPPTAVLAVCLCDGDCSAGTKDNDITFRDAYGRELCGYCGTHSCDKVGGRRRCSERLINLATEAFKATLGAL